MLELPIFFPSLFFPAPATANDSPPVIFSSSAVAADVSLSVGFFQLLQMLELPSFFFHSLFFPAPVTAHDSSPVIFSSSVVPANVSLSVSFFLATADATSSDFFSLAFFFHAPATANASSPEIFSSSAVAADASLRVTFNASSPGTTTVASLTASCKSGTSTGSTTSPPLAFKPVSAAASFPDQTPSMPLPPQLLLVHLCQ